MRILKLKLSDPATRAAKKAAIDADITLSAWVERVVTSAANPLGQAAPVTCTGCATSEASVQAGGQP